MSTATEEYRHHVLCAAVWLVAFTAMFGGSFAFDGTGWGAALAEWAVVPVCAVLYHISACRVLRRVLSGELTTTTPTPEEGS